MAQSVKLNEEIMALVRHEAKLQHRSVAGQIAHWVAIGHAIEMSGAYDHRRVNEALQAALPPEDLTGEEHEVWLESFSAQMAEPSAAEEAHFAKRRQLGRGVGLAENGEIIHATPES